MSMRSSLPGARSAAPRSIFGLAVAGLIRGAARGTRALLFWAAILLAPSALVAVALGLADLPSVAALLGANVVALIGGHRHRLETVAAE